MYILLRSLGSYLGFSVVGALFACIVVVSMTNIALAQAPTASTSEQMVSSIRADTHVVDIATSSTIVSLKYPAHTKILGVLALEARVKVSVNSDGVVEVKYPWYGMFLTTDTAALQAKIQAAVRGTLSPSDASSNKTVLKDRQFSLDEQVSVLQAIHTVLKENFTSLGSAQTRL